ncbi:MAG: YidC/Oxa1 family membrane protein insertase [Chloroflexi bacterium]|nr:YidC/Oxa1 family membrane protein insertase [Chloroflexota bacterium]
MEILGDIWNFIIIQPMINSLALLYSIFFDNFGIAILLFTIILRALMIPLTLRQTRQLRAMSSIQPKIKELQQRYSKDRQRLSQETLRLYREHGVNPIGCLGPIVLQFPIFIGLFQTLRAMLPSTPEALIDLSGKLYPWLPRVNQEIPLDSTFLGLDLGAPDPTPILPVLVALTTFLVQKMTTMPSADPRQASTNRMLLWMMPIFLGFLTFQFESGLAIYWVMSNIVGAVIQGFIMGWSSVKETFSFRRPQPVQPDQANAPALLPPDEERETVTDDAPHSRNDSKDARRGHRTRPKRTRRGSRGGRNRRR